MFIKTIEIKNLIVYTKSFTEEEIKIIKKKLKSYNIYFLIPDGEDTPYYIEKDDNVIFERLRDRILEYQNLLQNTINEAGIPSYQWVMISKDKEQIKYAIKQPIGTILISNSEFEYKDIGYLPDMKIDNVNQIEEKLTKNTGYFSEVCSTLISKDISYGHEGSFFHFNVDREGIVFRVAALGRYFKTTHDYFNCHQLSNRIRKSKFDFKSQLNLFASLFNPVIEIIHKQHPVNGVTRVPSRPNKVDRFKELVQIISEKNQIKDYSNILTCNINYPPHKELNSNQRFQNVKDVFSVNTSIDKDHIVIIDDVIVSGATLFEAAKALYLAGASKVTAVVLGVNQFPTAFTYSNTQCPVCEGQMILKFNSKDNSAFYGCENFSKNNCRHSESFLVGWHNILRRNSIDVNKEISEDSLFF
ncbi:competence protein [Bacillus subtilis]|uniref:ComF family protein n=1 Tax=Bacillus subtilis TaxID=1423 RepID=UPI00157D336A|nr:competence protein [Bacillus subtilis]MBE1867331.1 competence protein [Bacillus subtilis]MEA1024757.1 competence protein [Bacillus subtilis]NUC10808.1 competence protein [Bacillus subtilis]